MKALFIATDGFEDSELLYPYWRLEEAGFDVELATPDGDAVEGKMGHEWEADYDLDHNDPDDWAGAYDVLVLPGGRSPENLRTEAPVAAEIVAAFDREEQPIASICHGAQLLISADVIDGREIAAYWTLEVDVENAGATFADEEAVVDDHFVTARAPSDLPAFMSAALDVVDQRLSLPA